MGNIFANIEKSVETVSRNANPTTLLAASTATAVLVGGGLYYFLYNSNNARHVVSDLQQTSENIHGVNVPEDSDFAEEIYEEEQEGVLGSSFSGNNTAQALYLYIVSILILIAEIQTISLHNSLNPALLPLFTPLFWTIVGLGISTHGIMPIPLKYRDNSSIRGNDNTNGCIDVTSSSVSNNNEEGSAPHTNIDSKNRNVIGIDLGSTDIESWEEKVSNIDDLELKKYEAEDKLAKLGTCWSEILQTLEKQLEQEPNNCQILWRAARALYNMAQQQNLSKEQKKEYIYTGYNYVKKAIDNNGRESSKCNTWYGIMLNALGDFEGVNKMVGNLLVVKEFWVNANKLSKTDSSPPHLIGRWCKGILETTWWEKKALSAIFGGEMPKTDWEEALFYFEEAESRQMKLVQSGQEACWLTNTKCLAECLIKVGRHEEAKGILLSSLGSVATSEEDKTSKLEIEKILKSI